MRQDKNILKDEIRSQIEHFGSFVIINYLGLSANAMNQFRTEVAGLGGAVEMVRKRVLIKAAESAGISLEQAALPGHIGLVFAGQDPFEMAKLVFKYSQQPAKKVNVIGGRVEGQMYAADQMAKLATLPSKDEMRAQLLATLEAPMAQTLAVMEAILSSVVYCLDNKCKQ
jgi:large subunit ribosomal protein L10